jgi:hypothetical protein
MMKIDGSTFFDRLTRGFFDFVWIYIPAHIQSFFEHLDNHFGLKEVDGCSHRYEIRARVQNPENLL